MENNNNNNLINQENILVLEEKGSKIDLQKLCNEMQKDERYGAGYYIVLSEHEMWFDQSETTRKFRPLVFAQCFVKTFKIYSVGKVYYIYENGVYRERNGDYLSSIITKLFGTIDFKTAWVNDAISFVKDITQIDFSEFVDTFNAQWNYINVRNGLIKINKKNGTYELVPHTKDLLSTIQLNVNFSKENKSTPYWDKFLKSSLNTDKEREFLKQVMGYSFINYLADNDGQSFFYFDGEGGNGKGTIFRLLSNILKGYTTTERSNNLFNDDNQNQFYGFNFIHKLLVLVPEIEKKLKNLGLVKNMSGKDPLNYQVKGMMETKEFTYGGKVIVSGNNDTEFGDTSKGVDRRIKFIVMNNTIKERILDLDRHLVEESDEIFKQCLDALMRLIQNKWFFDLPESHFTSKAKHFEHSDNFLSFVRKHIVPCVGGKVIVSDIPELFNVVYSGMYRKKDKVLKDFEKALGKEDISFEIKKTRCNSVIDGKVKNTHCYEGFTYVEYKDENTCIESDITKPDIDYIITATNYMTDDELIRCIEKMQLKLKASQFANKAKELEAKAMQEQPKQVKI